MLVYQRSCQDLATEFLASTCISTTAKRLAVTVPILSPYFGTQIDASTIFYALEV